MKKKILLNPTIFDVFAKFNNSYIFIGDLETDEYQWSKNSLDEFHLSDEYTDYPDIWEQLIVKEDLDNFLENLKKLKSKEKDQMQGEYRMVKKDGNTILAKFNICQMTIDEGNSCFAGTITDLMSKKGLDPITGLRTSFEFKEVLEALAAKGEQFGVLILGIDDFKQINDLHSYTVGDEVLGQCAAMLERITGDSGKIFRLDGDSFGVVYIGADKGTLASKFVKLQEVTMVPLMVQEMKVPITISGAGCVCPDDGENGEQLFRCARIALNVAKNNGGSQFVAYSKEIAAKVKREMLLLEKLRESVNHNFSGFSLNYQPLIYNRDGKLYGCEVLLRWTHPDFPEDVTPMEFVPILENTGLILKVGEWVVENALSQCAKWVKFMPNFQMSINATCAQFEAPEFRFFVMDCLCRERLNPNLITLELTESNKIGDTQAVSHAFDFFRGQGIKIAFDDFGMGYASLDIFRLLSADELKIDKSFLERLSYDVTDQKIIANLINLCNSMNMYVCVEGVETAEVRNIVQQLGPTLLQGYLYNRPMTAEKFENYYFKENQDLTENTAAENESTLWAQEQTMVYSELKPAQPLSMDELVNNTHAGIFQVGMDHEFTFVTCNEGYRRMLGYTAKQIEEKFKNQALGFVHPDDLRYVNDEIRRQLGLGDTVTIEFRIVRADGTPLWIMGTGNVVRGKNGSLSLTVVIINNDEAKKRSLALEKNCKSYKRILDRMPLGMKCVRYDEDFTLEYISPAFLNLVGYNEQEIRVKFQNKYINLIYEEDRLQLFNDIFEQLKESNIVTLRYRTPCKDGRLIWVEMVSRLCAPDEDGIQRCYSSIVNITDSITDEQKQHSRSLANRYQQAAAQWGDILFEYNTKAGAISFSKEYGQIFGRDPKNTLDEELYYIHEEDRNIVLRSLQKVQEGMRCVPVEVRVQDSTGKYIWCAMYLNEPDLLGNVPMTILGKICNIHEDKIEREKLLAQSQQDLLTGLLNKSTLEEKIRINLSAAKPWEDYAMFMIDIDDFKNINDKKGHPYGDAVLRELAKRMKGMFGKDGLIGRAGGDEFMAFRKLPEDYCLEEEVQKMLDKLCGIYELDGVKGEIYMSMGIALCPLDGTNFYDLFRRADSALYHAKAKGKNQWCLSSSGDRMGTK